MASEDKIQEVISTFVCNKDKDIEIFLKEKAISFEKVSKSRTYFIVDEETLEAGEFNILAYFSVAMQVLKVPVELSNRKVKNLDGLFSKRNGETITEFPVFLIGQLAKNDTYEYSITGKEIIEFAMSIIYTAHEKVGGRIVLVECADKKQLIDFYINNDFEIIRQDEDNLIQLIRMIDYI